MKQQPLNNWTTGMKITTRDFLQLENALIGTIKNSNRSNVKYYSYGFLTTAESGFSEGLDYELHQDGHGQLKISLNYLNALFFNGLSINLTPEICKSIFQHVDVSHFEEKHSGVRYYLLVCVDSNHRLPYGEVDESIVPHRHKNALFNVTFEMIPVDAIGDFAEFDSSLVLGEYEVIDELYSPVRDYVPPTANCQAFQHTREFYRETVEAFKILDQSALKIADKCLEKPSKLTDSIRKLMISIGNRTSLSYFDLNNLMVDGPPIYVIREYALLAAEIRVVFRLLGDAEKEEMLKYFEEWTQISPAQLQDAIRSVLAIEYSHLNINQSLVSIDDFRQKFLAIFRELNELEFIGKRRQDLGIVYEKKKSNPKQSLFNPIRR